MTDVMKVSWGILLAVATLACGPAPSDGSLEETGGIEAGVCPDDAKDPVIAAIDCNAWEAEAWGAGQWSNFDGTSAAPWDGQGNPPWEDWSSVEPCTASRTENPNHQDPGVLPIHAVHLPAKKIIVWEGRHDQHVWDFQSNTWEWYPLTTAAGNDCFTEQQLEDAGIDPTLTLDLFCAGHALDADGNLLTAGGNLTGNSDAGAICSHVLPFDAYADGSGAVDPSEGNLCPGDLMNLVEPNTSPWVDSGQHSVQRWYPTLTTLASGDILMTAGFTINNFEGELFEIFDGDGWSVAGSSGLIPSYPMMFVTPQGSLLYAGSENAISDAEPAIIFSLNDDGFWEPVESAPSPVRGGSAVMYAPGKVMKSGGGTRPVCAETGSAPLATTAVIDLSSENMGFEDTGFPMHQRRHFHTLTLLPDGTVLATGGNSCGNGESGTGTNSCFADQDSLTECEDGDLGCVEVTSIPCQVKGECPLWATCGNDIGSILDCPGNSCTCNPGNNACYATPDAELWDPATERWCLMAEQSFERMYHSTALLMPDGRVMGTGNGRRQGLTSWETAEFFSPPYLLNGTPRPEVAAINDLDVASGMPTLSWGETVTVSLAPGTTFDEVGRVTLVRLGSVTHQLDMEQRHLDLGCFWETGSDSQRRATLTVHGPQNGNLAPPGYYMLFLVTEAGTPSMGHYVKVGG